MADLPSFESHDVREASMKITKAGDGLSDALDLQPVAYRVGERVFFVLEGEVTQVNHRPVKPGSLDLVRVHTLVTQHITEVDEDDVGRFLADSRDRLRLEHEKREGVQRLGDELEGELLEGEEE